MQQDMIKHHMFPITIMPPRTVAGWLLCFYDKLAAVNDYAGKNKGKWLENNEKNITKKHKNMINEDY